MFDDRPRTSDTLASLQESHQQLADLMPRLQSANEAFADAARPLDKLSEMDSNQKREVARRIRAAEQECDEVSQLIHRVLAKAAATGNHVPLSPVGNRPSSSAAKDGAVLVPAADGLSLFVHRWLPPSPPKAVVQIAHGVAEHGGRYNRLAAALNGAGYAVYASDHRGHGQTARAPEDLGFFSERYGWQKCMRDLWDINRRIAVDHPGLPIVLLGHSMGSFMTQHFIGEHGDALSGVVLCGTSGKTPPGAAAVRVLARVERLRLGPRGKSPFIGARTFRAFNKQFEPARTPFDWLSRDAAEVALFAADPLCGSFRPSVQLAMDILEGIVEVAKPERHARIPKSLPIYIIAGTRDPVGVNGDGVERLLRNYVNAGLERVTHRFYLDARHELFNETNRDEVTSDLIHWLDDVVP